LLKFHNSREYADRMKPLNDEHFANTRFKTGPLHSKGFNIPQLSVGEFPEVKCMKLSHDETFFITGGKHENKPTVVKLSMGDVFGIQTELKPSVIVKNPQSSNDYSNWSLCLAISPDDRRIFSGGWSPKVFINDAERSVFFNKFNF